LLDRVLEADTQRAGIAEIAHVGKKGTLADIERIDGFRHQEVQVGIALAMGMGAHVDGHVVDGDREIGAVVEIEAAQEILIGFTLAAVLRHGQPESGLQDFAGACDRARVEVVAGPDDGVSEAGRRGPAAGRTVAWRGLARCTVTAMVGRLLPLAGAAGGASAAGGRRLLAGGGSWGAGCVRSRLGSQLGGAATQRDCRDATQKTRAHPTTSTPHVAPALRSSAS
jgi:hypothetical protein